MTTIMDSTTTTIAIADVRHAFDTIRDDPLRKDESCEDRESRLAALFPRIKNTYPYLFHKACTDPLFDNERLDYMLQMLHFVRNQEMPQTTASEEVGRSLFDTYVKPMLDATGSTESNNNNSNNNINAGVGINNSTNNDDLDSLD